MLLEFEKPIAELEAKLEDMKHLAGDSDDKVREAIKALEKKIKDLKTGNIRKPYGLATCPDLTSPGKTLYARLHLRNHY
jgi:acetyl-CoA carboxylase alpha subunit